VDEARLFGVSQRKTCEFLGIAARTIQNWRHEGLCDKRKGSSRKVAHSLTQNEQDAFFSLASSPRFRDNTPEQIVATLAQEGTYIASVSSLYRILRKRDALRHRQESRQPAKQRFMKHIPVTGPNQFWSWDITWLRTIVGPKIKTERADELEWDYTAFLYPWNDAYRWSGVSYPRD
jgi:hypothetical protein